MRERANQVHAQRERERENKNERKSTRRKRRKTGDKWNRKTQK